MPQMEAEQEIEGLRFWAGDAAVQLLESDHTYNAMVLERCTPGTSLKYATEEKQRYSRTLPPPLSLVSVRSARSMRPIGSQ